MSTLVVLQPSYLPWLGYFDLMRRADVFVIYDDVPFDKHGWRNRNRIKTRDGAQWLTVPVRHHGLGQPLNSDIAIAAPFARKHLTTLQQQYAAAPFREHYLPALQAVLQQPWQRLLDLNLALLHLLRGWLGLTTPLLRSSQLAIDGERNQRLINLCRHCGADVYLSGNAGQNYLDEAAFAAAGVSVAWHNYAHPVYPQLHGDFLPYLSVLDLLLNVGPDSSQLFTKGAL